MTTSSTPPYALSIEVKSLMRDAGIASDIVDAIDRATSNVTEGMDASAHAYARAMPRAFDEFGVDGVKHQVMYLLLYMKSWTGEDARDSKKLLRKWTISN